MKCIDKRLSVMLFTVALFAVTSLVGCKTKAGAQSLLLRPENRKPELVRPARHAVLSTNRHFPHTQTCRLQIRSVTGCLNRIP